MSRIIRPEQLNKAIELGMARHNIHKPDPNKHWLNGQGKSGNVPDSSNRCYANIIGMLGEILFRDYIYELAQDRSQWWVEFPILVAKKAQQKLRHVCRIPPWDARVNGYRVEVKTVPPGPTYAHLLVKKREFHPVDYWIAIKLVSETEYNFAGYAVMKEILANGLTEKFGKALCYYRLLSELRPMSLLLWFPPKG